MNVESFAAVRPGSIAYLELHDWSTENKAMKEQACGLIREYFAILSAKLSNFLEAVFGDAFLEFSNNLHIPPVVSSITLLDIQRGKKEIWLTIAARTF